MESKKLSDRVKFYARFKQFLATVETTIRYRATPLASLVAQAAESYPTLTFLSRCEQELCIGRDFPSAWQCGVKACGKSQGLKKEDFDLLFSLDRDWG